MPATLDIMQTLTKFVRILGGSRVMFARTTTGHFAIVANAITGSVYYHADTFEQVPCIDLAVNAVERAAYVTAAREIVGAAQ